MKFSSAVLLLALLLATKLPAMQAQVQRPATSQPVERARIRQGMRSGELTPAEVARLYARETNITATKQAARADGMVTPAERCVVRSAAPAEPSTAKSTTAKYARLAMLLAYKPKAPRQSRRGAFK